MAVIHLVLLPSLSRTSVEHKKENKHFNPLSVFKGTINLSQTALKGNERRGEQTRGNAPTLWTLSRRMLFRVSVQIISVVYIPIHSAGDKRRGSSNTPTRVK